MQLMSPQAKAPSWAWKGHLCQAEAEENRAALDLNRTISCVGSIFCDLGLKNDYLLYSVSFPMPECF